MAARKQWSSSDRSLGGQQQPDAASQGYIIPLSISSWRHCITPHHHKKKGKSSTITYFERKRDHLHITSVTAYCYNCSILLLLLIFYWAYFINFLMDRKKHSLNRVLVLSMVAGTHWGSGNVSPTDKGDNCICKMTRSCPILSQCSSLFTNLSLFFPSKYKIPSSCRKGESLNISIFSYHILSLKESPNLKLPSVKA